jgi:anti-anti-sigma regulatory factor
MMPLHEEQVALSGPILGGRDNQTKDELLTRLKALPANSMLVLDLDQVQFMDYSWADEVVANLLKASQRAKTPRFVVVRRPSHSVSESIAAAVSLHGLTCVQVDSQGNVSVLGSLSPALLLTYNLAVARGQISAQDLPDTLSPSTKSNRLKELERRGLLYRVGEEIIDGGGRRFIYEPVR